MSIKDDMNSSGEYLPTKWTRTTVADGDWLQENTIKPLSSRDNFLADKIGESNSAWKVALSSESATRYSDDQYLSANLTALSSEYETFKSKTEGNIDYLSGSIDGLKDDLDKEIEDRSREDGLLQDQINTIKAATDVVDVVGTHAALVAYDEPLTKNDVVKVLVDETSGNLEYYWRVVGDVPKKPYQWEPVGTITPYYSKSEIDNKETALSSTIANNYLSASTAAVSAGKNILVTKESGPVIGIKTPDDVSFSNLTSTNTISTNFSGETLSGETLYTSIDGLIESATNGGAMTALKNVSTINLYDSEKQPTTINFTTTADTLGFYVSGGANNWMNFVKYNDSDLTNPTIAITGNFEGKVNEMLDDYLLKAWSGYNDSKFNGSARLAGSADLANSASIATNTQDKITAYYKEGNTNKTGTFNVSSLKLSAGKGINFVSGANQLSISSEGTTYTTGQYINISNDNKISVTGDLINSAQSGQSAYNWITSQSATLSAGPGIKFTSAGQNTMGISVKYTTTNGYVTELDGIPLSAGANYTPGRCITIDDQNKINLSSDINLNEKLVIDHYNSSDRDTYTSATLECFQLKFNGASDNQQTTYHNSAIYDIFGIQLYDANASKHILMNNENGLCISSYQGNLSSYSRVDATFIELDYKANVAHASPYYLKFDGNKISAGSNTGNITVAQWSDIINKANGTWVSATSQEIVIDAKYQTKFVVTDSVPGSFNANTYYII